MGFQQLSPMTLSAFIPHQASASLQVRLLWPRNARGGSPDVLQGVGVSDRGTDLPLCVRRGDGIHQLQRHHGHPNAAEGGRGGWTTDETKLAARLTVDSSNQVPAFFLHQVVLLTSDEDPVAQSLAGKLAQRTNCLVIEVGKDPLENLTPLVEKRKLQWNDVAYMGNMHVIRQLASGLVYMVEFSSIY